MIAVDHRMFMIKEISMTIIRPRRSVLYMPSANERALEKAANLAVDALIFDLEDAVAPEEKSSARDKIADAFQKYDYGHREKIIRMNSLESEWGEDDLNFIAQMDADAILIPKVNSGEDIADIHNRLNACYNLHSRQKALDIWVMIETPLAILNLQDIAQMRQQDIALRCFVMGTNDLAKDTKVSFAQNRYAFMPWLMQAVATARAYGIDIIDGVYNDFQNEVGFLQECEQGKLMGMDGKTLIHPKQIDACNDVFSPSQEDIAEAEAIIAAFQHPENQHKGAIKLNGKMVEKLHLSMAERLIATKEAMART